MFEDQSLSLGYSILIWNRRTNLIQHLLEIVAFNQQLMEHHRHWNSTGMFSEKITMVESKLMHMIPCVWGSSVRNCLNNGLLLSFLSVFICLLADVPSSPEKLIAGTLGIVCLVLMSTVLTMIAVTSCKQIFEWFKGTFYLIILNASKHFIILQNTTPM